MRFSVYRLKPREHSYKVSTGYEISKHWGKPYKCTVCKIYLNDR